MTRHAARVLTIDDDHLVRRFFTAVLSVGGFDVIEAPDGAAGLERFRGEAPDAVLCDLRMPGLDGLDVLATITEESPDTPVIVVSGQGTMSDAVQALKQGAADFVTKPLHEPELLVQSVRRALEKAELRRENRAHRAHLEELNQSLERALAELRADQEAGRQIQHQLLPDREWHLDGYTFDRCLFPSSFLSGDFVDYFSLDATHAGMYVADVSGHGAASAFVTAMLTALVGKYREALLLGSDDTAVHPERLLAAIDKDIGSQSLNSHLTMFYAVLDQQTHRLTYSSGGQFPYPVLFDGTAARFLECPGRPLGLFADSTFEVHHVVLSPGARLLVVSDGVLELDTGTPRSERRSRLLGLVGHHTTTGSVVEALGIGATRELRDDVALLLVSREGSRG